MKHVFAEFWRINLGHVAACFVFIFGLGVAWSKQENRVELLDQRETSRFENVKARLDVVESWQREANAILKAIEAMQAEQRHVNESLREMRSDVKDIQRRLPTSNFPQR